MEKIDVAITIAGSEVTSTWARNSASRAALPPTNCAVTTPAPMMAVTTADADGDWEEMLKVLHSLLAMFSGDLTGHPEPHTRQRDVQAGECGSGEPRCLAESDESG